MTAITETPTRNAPVPFEMLELEITGACQLSCEHCYADSGPRGTHGTMSVEDWRTAILDAAALGVPRVQLIGGEPLLNPAWVELTGQALDCGMMVEIFSNLYTVKDSWWSVLAMPGVSLATSYYSSVPDEHDRITRRPGSHVRTRENIVEAVRRHIPIRVGILEVFPGQRVQEAHTELEELGVTDIGTDRMRRVGRGAASAATPNVSELCGNCGKGRGAISPTGVLSPCVLSRFLPTGNVKTDGLAGVLAGQKWADAVAQIPDRGASNCSPDGADCNPANTPACNPAYDDIFAPRPIQGPVVRGQGS